MEDAHNSEQMPEILNRPLNEFMMDLCFPAVRSAGPYHCNECFSPQDYKKTKPDGWIVAYKQEQRLKNWSENDRNNTFPLSSLSSFDTNSVWLSLNLSRTSPGFCNTA